jgi:ABC-2 type transport system permease protein
MSEGAANNVINEREDRQSTIVSSTALAVKQTFLISYMMGVIFLRRSPVRIVLEVSIPFSFLFVLFVVSGGEHIHVALAGTIVMAFGTSGLWVGMDIAENRIEYRMQDIFVASPVSPITYMVGLALAQLLVAVVPLSILAGFVIYFSGSLLNIPMLAATVLLIFGTMSAIGFFVSSHIAHLRTVNDTIVALMIVLGMLAPVYYSVQILPLGLQYLAYAIPTTHASLILQYMMGLPMPPGWWPGIGLAIQLALFVGFLALVKTKAVWRDK